jgi:tRNA(Ile)-lysidine synthetase-like protein
VCERLGVTLRVHRVDARPASGESPEDAARRARYGALAALAQADGMRPGIRSIALGQHADDQVETVLLALSRGAGLAGLAAMPAVALRDGLAFHRPLLGVSATEIRAWLRARDVQWIEDPSNADVRFTRNRIRAELLPALDRAFPQFRSTFARSAPGHRPVAPAVARPPGECLAPLVAAGARLHTQHGATRRAAGPGRSLHHARPPLAHQDRLRLRRAERGTAPLVQSLAPDRGFALIVKVYRSGAIPGRFHFFPILHPWH